MRDILMEKRITRSLLPSVREVVDILTLDPERPPELVGSYRYTIHEYPVDIDLFEDCRVLSATEAGAVKILSSRFRKMSRRVGSRRLTYLADFKAGVDERFRCPYLGMGFFGAPEFRPPNPKRTREWINDLHQRGLITERERNDWTGRVIDDPTFLQQKELALVIREKYVVRWTTEEIISGLKTLPGGTVIRLSDALKSRTVVKIDLWAWIDQRFVSVTNWFRIRWRPPGNRQTWRELTERVPRYEESLKDDILEYYHPSFEKSLKLAKRLWVYAAHTRNVKLMRLLYPLFRSDAARLEQVSGEIEVLISMLGTLRSPPLAHIREQVHHFSGIVSTVTSNILTREEKNRIFDEIERIDSPIKSMASSLETIQQLIRARVQRYVYAYLKKHKIFRWIESILGHQMLSPDIRPSEKILIE